MACGGYDKTVTKYSNDGGWKFDKKTKFKDPKGMDKQYLKQKKVDKLKNKINKKSTKGDKFHCSPINHIKAYKRN